MIRQYEPQDTDAVIAVWQKANALAHPFLKPEFTAHVQHDIRHLYLPNTETWVYEKDGNLIGFIALAGHEVGALFLDPAYHGQGIGKAMMDKATHLHPTLELEVFTGNHIGRRFYAHYGFTEGEESLHEPSGFPIIRLHYRAA